MASAFIEYLPYAGPVVSDGFGLGYIIKDEGMQICCTSFRCPIFYHGFLQARGPFVVLLAMLDWIWFVRNVIFVSDGRRVAL